jgi:hypothetical protein
MESSGNKILMHKLTILSAESHQNIRSVSHVHSVFTEPSLQTEARSVTRGTAST